MEPIKFFGRDGKYAIFSNFAYTPLVINELKYKTAEHYFQSMKFVDTNPEYAEIVRNSNTPKECKKLGSTRDYRINPRWNSSEKIKVMETVLFCKAMQNEKFKNLLLESGNAEIVEASWDNFWGEGKAGDGENMLGKLLVELRTYLRR